MKNVKLVVALLISIAFGATVFVQYERNHTLVSQLNQKDQELSSSKSELQIVKTRLAIAEKKLGFLDKYKTGVQVTAYAAAPDRKFSDGTAVLHAYAVPRHTLPEDKVVNVALSPVAQRKLHAKLNDYIVLIQKRSHRKTIAHFVDLTADTETRSVVDVFFADAHQAFLWGRQGGFDAVNLSSPDSPFKGVL
jgi:hypothetical protein